MEQENQAAYSALQMIHTVVDEISFKRKGFADRTKPLSDTFQIGRAINKDSEGHYRVTLQTKVERENEFEVFLKMTGYFLIADDDPNLDTLLKKNAVAILFPFVRAELTLISSQPDTHPIMMPVVNVETLFNDKKQEIEE